MQTLAHAYNPKFDRNISFGDKPATFEKWQKNLEAPHAVCRKYPNLTNTAFSSEPLYEGNIKYHPAD